MEKPVVLDIFCGAGGMSEGFIQAGFNVSFASDINKAAELTYVNRHKQLGYPVKFACMDIKEFSKKEFLEKFTGNTKIDVVCGGPPCQGFSLAGKRSKDDPRNLLVKHYIQVINVMRPRYFVMENVEGILSFELDNFEGLNKDIYRNTLVIDVLKKEFDNIGYKIKYKVLIASDYGVPQQRKRVVFIGFRKTEKKIPKFPEGNIDKITVKEAIGDLEFLNDNEEAKEYNIEAFSEYQIKSKIGRTVGADGHTISSNSLKNHKASKHTELTKERFALLKQGETIKDLFNRLSDEDKEKYATRKNICRKIKENDLAPTVVTLPDDLVHYSKNRIMTVRELARLQSFDDSFEFLGKRTTGGKERKKELPQYTQVGNAVPPLLAKAVAEEIMKVLK